MDDAEKLRTSFQMFTISQETSLSPLHSQMLQLAKICDNHPYLKNCHAVLSHRFGKRVIITTTDSPFSSLKAEDFIELVDYDPIKQVLLIMGKKKPEQSAPVHFMILQAKTEIHTLLEIQNPDQIKNLDIAAETTYQTDKKEGIIGEAKTLLKGFRSSQIIRLQENSLFIIGRNLKEITHSLQLLSGGKKT